MGNILLSEMLVVKVILISDFKLKSDITFIRSFFPVI